MNTSKVVKVLAVGSENLALVHEDGSITVVKLIAEIPATAVESKTAIEAKPAEKAPASAEKAPAAKAPEPKEDPDDEWTEEEIDALDRDALIEVIDDEELDLDPDEFKSTVKLRRAVKEELGLTD
jgi:hypothetical protein